MKRFLPWIGFVVLFYICWIYLVASGGLWSTVAEHWSIAVAMLAGSYFAGSTPMGGGTIGFPVLVLAFGEDAALGRDFSFAIQSIGMTSAAVLIISMRNQLEWAMLRWSLLGSLIGTPLGIAFIAPYVGDLEIKLVFSIVWASFGLMHFVKVREFAAEKGMRPTTARLDRVAGLLIGFFGGATVASITGIGVDMLLYATLVTIVRADLRIAIPSSVVLMAFTSVVGIAARYAMGAFEDPLLSERLMANWLAASPVVVVGAPLGAVVVRWLRREPTLIIVSVLCVFQYVWTCYTEWEQMGVPLLLLTLGSVLAMNAGFHLMYRMGDRLAAPRVRTPADAPVLPPA